MYKARDLRERTVEDLKELEKSLRSDLFQNRLKNFTNRLDDTSAMKKARRDLGRVLTILGEKARGVVVTSAPAGEKPARAPKAPASKPAAAAKAPKAAAAKAAKPAAEKKATTPRASSKSSAKSEAK